MTDDKSDILIGNTPLRSETRHPAGEFVAFLGETYYRIADYDHMPPFFMSLVSRFDHWLFIASTGGLTAGRINTDSALFPYETEDKITAHSEQTGGKTIMRVTRGGRTFLWEPFSERYAGIYRCRRNMYKNVYGSKLVFEEVNEDLQLTFRTGWFTGDRFGFIRGGWLLNEGDSDCRVELLDGLQNILPYGATFALQTSFSSLMNAYKRNELDPETGLAIYALSATLSDRAEPSESLKATVVWQVGLDATGYLLCSEQLDAYRAGHSVQPERDVRGKAGAYFVNATLELAAGQSHHWRIVADVNHDSAATVRLAHTLHRGAEALLKTIDDDIDQNTASLVRYVAAADGLQLTSKQMATSHHFANVLFNIMRGGIFADGYEVGRDDLLDFVAVRNRLLLAEQANWFAALPARFSIQDLRARAREAGTPDLIRLCYEYMPLTFSRRHGDPSRPWNQFSINLKRPDGSPRLDYQGNWRDIFQNWEPLAHSYPDYTEGMLARFLNATTVDGYNPYRVTRDGIEWEIPDPDSPWANIGYWSDHQIIYLQKLLETVDHVYPGALEALWGQRVFAYANVPYRIRSYAEMLVDWNNTIDFDWQREQSVEEAVEQMGTDGRLLRDVTGVVVHATMVEKLLGLLLAKLANLVPAGGIWMNTQRPEWNDANNALVGKGLSVVTVAYLRRFVVFWRAQLERAEPASFEVNTAVAVLLEAIQTVFARHQEHLDTRFDDRERRAVMDELGAAVTTYRAVAYEEGLSGTSLRLSSHQIIDFLSLAQRYIDHTLRANLRSDGLTHSYNVLHLQGEEAIVEHLYLMLEGQVALLSSGMLAPPEALNLLQSLRHSDLYRADLQTYMLYPNRDLPGFLQKNNVLADRVAGSAIVKALTEAGDRRLLIRDETGQYHFSGDFRNANDAAAVLDKLAAEPPYAEMATAERAFILDLFENTFNHRAFTGRSGTFFAYEGLGSVYWHMVSKLLLAAQECYQHAEAETTGPALASDLANTYYGIRQGLGFNKTPAEYGAFPADPYSHTPLGRGAQQPGMTGQVKEEILARFGELGVSVRNGALQFRPTLLRSEEYIPEAQDFTYVDTAGISKTLHLPTNALAFTYCQTPVVYVRDTDPRIEVTYQDGRTATLAGCCLDEATSRHIFRRDGHVALLKVVIER